MDSNKKYDLIILGSGPAGVAAALTARKAHLNVLVISKEPESSTDQFTPLQSIHPGVVSLLEGLGLGEAVYNSSRNTFTAIQVNGSSNELGPADQKWHGHHMERTEFDRLLWSALNQNAIPIMPEVFLQLSEKSNGLKVKTTKNTYFTRYLIDATGHKRKTKAFLNLSETSITKPMTCWTGVSELDKIPQNTLNTSFISDSTGWTWIAPENNRRFTWTQLKSEKQQSYLPPLSGSRLISEVTAHDVRWRISRPVCKLRTLLCGDAAGVLDPAAGQGILTALTSGIMAARTVASCVNKPGLENYFFFNYDQWFLGQHEQMVNQLSRHYDQMNINVNLRLGSLR